MPSPRHLVFTPALFWQACILFAFFQGLGFHSLPAAENGKSSRPQKTNSWNRMIQRDASAYDRSSQVALSYANVVEKVRDSVVTVLVTRTGPPVGQAAEEDSLDLFRKKNTDKNQEEEHGSGSGVIFSTEGWIVTNAHVVNGADSIQVRLRGRDDSLSAYLAGMDTATDIALLKVEQTDLSAAVLGDSNQARPGDVVLAIGSPFGLEQTITLGIVSATGRGALGLMADGMEDFIQTDAAINPGNSGGPLLDGQGRVIGINTARYHGDNIGFAIPVNLASKIAGDLHAHGWVVRGFLGVTTVELNPDLLKELNLPAWIRGVIIKSVEMNQAAAKAGFLPGDLIQEANGRKVENGGRFRLSLASLQPGDTVIFKGIRKGKEIVLQATLGEPPTTASSHSDTAKAPLDSEEWLPGLHLADVNRDWRLKLKLSPQVTGLIVTQDFHAKDGTLRLASGDEILTVNGRPVKNLAQAKLEKDQARTSVLMLKVRTAGEDRFVMVPIPN